MVRYSYNNFSLHRYDANSKNMEAKKERRKQMNIEVTDKEALLILTDQRDALENVHIGGSLACDGYAECPPRHFGVADMGGFTLWANGASGQFANLSIYKAVLYSGAHTDSLQSGIIHNLMQGQGIPNA